MSCIIFILSVRIEECRMRTGGYILCVYMIRVSMRKGKLHIISIILKFEYLTNSVLTKQKNDLLKITCNSKLVVFRLKTNEI